MSNPIDYDQRTAIGGRIKGDFRISSELTYNTFPWPELLTGLGRDRIREAAQRVLDVRAHHAGSTLADL